MKTSNRSNTEPHLCKICFDIETSKNKVMSPCKCKGTSAYVHENCLKH